MTLLLWKYIKEKINSVSKRREKEGDLKNGGFKQVLQDLDSI